MKITLRNEFHGTEIKLVPHEEADGQLYLTGRQVHRAKQKLCGAEGCTCSGNLGTRGKKPQTVEGTEELVGIYFNRADGGCSVFVLEEGTHI